MKLDKLPMGFPPHNTTLIPSVTTYYDVSIDSFVMGCGGQPTSVVLNKQKYERYKDEFDRINLDIINLIGKIRDDKALV